MTEYLLALRYNDGLTVNMNAKFVHETPTKDELEKVIYETTYKTASTYNEPVIIFMQKLYSEVEHD